VPHAATASRGERFHRGGRGGERRQKTAPHVAGRTRTTVELVTNASAERGVTRPAQGAKVLERVVSPVCRRLYVIHRVRRPATELARVAVALEYPDPDPLPTCTSELRPGHGVPLEGRNARGATPGKAERPERRNAEGSRGVTGEGRARAVPRTSRRVPAVPAVPIPRRKGQRPGRTGPTRPRSSRVCSR
jgi:hypothetical protein